MSGIITFSTNLSLWTCSWWILQVHCVPLAQLYFMGSHLCHGYSVGFCFCLYSVSSFWYFFLSFSESNFCPLPGSTLWSTNAGVRCYECTWTWRFPNQWMHVCGRYSPIQSLYCCSNPNGLWNWDFTLNCWTNALMGWGNGNAISRDLYSLHQMWKESFH